MINALQRRPPWSITLRRCQREAIAAWLADTPENSLIEITPGGGKSLIVARLAHSLLESGTVGRVIVVVPTTFLRQQVTELLCSVGVHVADEYRPSMGIFPRHFDGLVTTYQQVAADAGMFAKLSLGAFVALDEVHHAAAHASWGQAVEFAFQKARFRLALTGTPFRDDEARVSFVPYRMGEAQPLYRYSYLDALRDGVVRPVEFKVFGAKVKWRSSSGVEREAETSTPCVSQDELSERLRALLWSDEWIAKVLCEAHSRLRDIRAGEQPNAAGLVGAIDMSHARHVAHVMARVFGQTPVLALSDDPKSARKIAAFRNSRDAWVVAVRQISEGVDIPRVRVPVHMTNITTRLFFAQFVPRGLRYQRDVPGEQLATAYLPEDPRLLAHAHTFTEAIRAWATEKKVGTPPLIAGGGSGGDVIESKFQVLETASYMVGTVRPGEASAVSSEERRVGFATSLRVSEEREGGAATTGSDGLPTQQENREEIVRLVAAFARLTGSEHARIHGLLKRRCGGALALATPAQLDSRLRLLRKWMREGRIT